MPSDFSSSAACSISSRAIAETLRAEIPFRGTPRDPFAHLVVDDHAVVRRGVRSLLESHEGWEVCGEATTGRDAVAQSLRLRPTSSSWI